MPAELAPQPDVRARRQLLEEPRLVEPRRRDRARSRPRRVRSRSCGGRAEPARAHVADDTGDRHLLVAPELRDRRPRPRPARSAAARAAARRRRLRSRARAAASRSSARHRAASRRRVDARSTARPAARPLEAVLDHTCKTRVHSGQRQHPLTSIRTRTGRYGFESVKAIILTREFPPEVYGGAGVHVEYLARELAKLIDLEVRCFGAPRERCARASRRGRRSPTASPALQTMSVDLAMAARPRRRRRRSLAHLVRDLRRPSREAAPRRAARRHDAQPRADAAVEGGAARRRRLRALLVLRADGNRGGRRRRRSVERDARRRPRRLPAGRRPSGSRSSTTGSTRISTAPTRRRTRSNATVSRATLPIVLFVGRITRQKGIVHLLDAALEISRDAQLVFCAGAPDEPEIERATRERVERCARSGRRRLDRGDAPEAGGDPAALARHRLLRAVDLRAARDRQPRGDGLRGAGRRLGGRRHPGGRRRRRDRPARAGRARRRREPGRSRPASRPTSRRGSTSSSPTRRARGRWARPADGGPSRSSAGARSRSARSRSTSASQHGEQRPPPRVARRRSGDRDARRRCLRDLRRAHRPPAPPDARRLPGRRRRVRDLGPRSATTRSSACSSCSRARARC